MATTTPKTTKALMTYAKPANPMNGLTPALKREILDGHAQGIGADKIRSWLSAEYDITVTRSQVRAFIDREQAK